MADDDEDGSVSPEIEEKARENNWVPKSEWKGKPEYWMPADKWLEKTPKTYIPKLEKEIGKLKGQLAKQETDFSDRLKRLETTTSRRLEQERDRMEREYEGRILKATELGDTEAVKKAMTDQKKDMKALDEKAEKAEDKQEPKAGELPPELKKELEEWAEENDWFNTDRRLRRVAIALYDEVEEDMPNASVRKKLDEVRKRCEEEFPAKFAKDAEDDPPRRGSRVEGGSRNSNGSGSKKLGWSDIKAGDREIAKNMIGEGKMFKDQADYAKDYWEANAEEA